MTGRLQYYVMANHPNDGRLNRIFRCRFGEIAHYITGVQGGLVHQGFAQDLAGATAYFRGKGGVNLAVWDTVDGDPSA